MKRAKIGVFLGLGLALLAGWWLLRGEQRQVADVPQLPAVITSAPSAAEVDPAVEVRAPDEHGLVAEPAGATRTVSEPAPAAAPAADAKRLTVFGRTVDEFDKPLAGATARLQANRVWTEGVDAPRFPGKTDLRGFEVATDAEGVFRFEVPWPTNETTWLTLEPDVFHDSATVYFGGGRLGNRAPITVVEPDLGVFRLVASGAIRGRVTDTSGKPLADARFTVANELTYTVVRTGTSDASGAFVITHLPPGGHGVRAYCTGYLYEYREPVVVRAGAFTDAVDFALAPAPTLTGTVLDEAGLPIEGVKLRGLSPLNPGSSAGAESRADGSFTIFLPRVDSYTLEATKAGFLPWHVNDRTSTYESGTSAIGITMVPSPGWELLVRDGQTQRPILEYGVQVLRDHSAHAEHHATTEAVEVPSTLHPNGAMLVEFRPGADVLVVSSAGYGTQRIDLEPGPPPGGPIVANLVGAGSVAGRLVQGEEPAASVRLVLEGGDALPGTRDRAIRFRPAGSRWAADEPSQTLAPSFAFRRTSRRFAVSDEQGRFHIEGVGHGAYLLSVDGSAGLALERAPFAVEGKTVDLGDIQVVHGAAIVGEVLAPPGRSRSGLKVRLDDSGSGAQQVTDSEGRFRFQGLAAGVHGLELEPVPGAIAGMPPLRVELASGEVRELKLDASGAGTCHVCLTILLGSEPASNARVEISVPRAADAAQGNWRQDASGRESDFTPLGSTDARGRVCGTVPARGAGHVVIRTGPMELPMNLPMNLPIEHPSAEIALVLDAQIDQTVSFELGRLVLALPEQTTLARPGLVRVFLSQGSDRRRVQSLYVNHDSRQPVRSWTFERVLAGEYELQVEIVPTLIEAGEQSSVLFSATQAVTIRPGETNEVQLH